jgi:hypothetical protein
VNLLSDLKRWADGILLDSVSRGQEFVLDCDDYPEAQVWLLTSRKPFQRLRMHSVPTRENCESTGAS